MTTLSNVFDVFSPSEKDESVGDLRYVSYPCLSAITSSTNNFELQTLDNSAFILMSKAFLEVKGTLSSTTDTYYDCATGSVAIINHSASLFDNAQYYIDGQQIEEVAYVPMVANVRGLMEYSEDFGRSQATAMNWFPDTVDTADVMPFNSSAFQATGGIQYTTWYKQDQTGATFLTNIDYNEGFHKRQLASVGQSVAKQSTFFIPLKEIFGFAEVPKVSRGVKHSIQLKRSSDAQCIHRGTTLPSKWVFTDIKLWVPLLTPSLGTLARIEKGLASGASIPVDFHARNMYKSTSIASGTTNGTWRVSNISTKPVKVFVFAQEDSRWETQTETPAILDHCNISAIHLRVNGKQVPAQEYEMNYITAGSEDWARAYTEFLASSGKGVFDYDTGSIVSYQDYKDKWPIYAFDLTNVIDPIFTGSADLEVRYRLTSSVGATWSLFCLVISEKKLRYVGIGGQQMRVELA